MVGKEFRSEQAESQQRPPSLLLPLANESRDTYPSGLVTADFGGGTPLGRERREVGERFVTPELQYVANGPQVPQRHSKRPPEHVEADKRAAQQLQKHVNNSHLPTVIKAVVGVGLALSEFAPVFFGYSVGDAVTAGEVLVGRTIYGQRLNWFERTLFGVAALIPGLPSRVVSEGYFQLIKGRGTQSKPLRK